MFLIYLLVSVFTISAQTSKEELTNTFEKTGGVYYSYPHQSIKKQTPTPKGYEVSYLSHFGRHGSRYLINDTDYKWTIDLLEEAKSQNALSHKGEEVLDKLNLLWKEVEHKGGDLSPLGVREQRGIAERMYSNYPALFDASGNYNAVATTVVRCVLSMDAFSERIKELNPKLTINRDAGLYRQSYLNHHTAEAIAWRSADDTWREEYYKFEDAHINPDRLIESLFKDSDFILKKVNPRKLMKDLHKIASGMQNVETETDFYDIFEAQELIDIWQCNNYRLYVNDANSSMNNNLMFENCKPVLKRMIDEADASLQSGKKGADFKFAHDGNIIPLAMLMHLDGCYNSIDSTSDFYKVWSDFKVAPMAGNIQMVFYTNKKDSNDVLVKFLLHENEISVPPISTSMAPYYKWSDVKEYYLGVIDGSIEP